MTGIFQSSAIKSGRESAPLTSTKNGLEHNLCASGALVDRIRLATAVSVSQSVHYIFPSHLGLIRCLTLIVRVSTQHYIDTFTIELKYHDKIVLPKELYHD
jgi:hypothetical protein